MLSPYPGVSKAVGSLTAGRSYRARRSMSDRRFPGRRRSMPVRRSCSGPPGGPRCCWRLSACTRRSACARRSPRPRRSPGVGGLLGLAEPVSPGRVSSVSLGLPFLSVGRFMPVYLPFGSCSAARRWAPTRRVLDPWERSVDAWRKRVSCQAVRAARLAPRAVWCTLLLVAGLTDFEGEGARVKGPSTARTSRRVSIHRRRTRKLLRGSSTQSCAIL